MSERRRGKNRGKEPINKGTKLTDEQKFKSILASQHRYKIVYFYDEAKNLVTVYIIATCKAEKAIVTVKWVKSLMFGYLKL